MKATSEQIDIALSTYLQHPSKSNLDAMEAALNAVFASMEAKAPQRFRPGNWQDALPSKVMPMRDVTLAGPSTVVPCTCEKPHPGCTRFCDFNPPLSGHATVSRETIMKYANDLPPQLKGHQDCKIFFDDLPKPPAMQTIDESLKLNVIGFIGPPAMLEPEYLNHLAHFDDENNQ